MNRNIFWVLITGISFLFGQSLDKGGTKHKSEHADQVHQFYAGESARIWPGFTGEQVKYTVTLTKIKCIEADVDIVEDIYFKLIVNDKWMLIKNGSDFFHLTNNIYDTEFLLNNSPVECTLNKNEKLSIIVLACEKNNGLGNHTKAEDDYDTNLGKKYIQLTNSEIPLNRSYIGGLNGEDGNTGRRIQFTLNITKSTTGSSYGSGNSSAESEFQDYIGSRLIYETNKYDDITGASGEEKFVFTYTGNRTLQAPNTTAFDNTENIYAYCGTVPFSSFDENDWINNDSHNTTGLADQNNIIEGSMEEDFYNLDYSNEGFKDFWQNQPGNRDAVPSGVEFHGASEFLNTKIFANHFWNSDDYNANCFNVGGYLGAAINHPNAASAQYKAQLYLDYYVIPNYMKNDKNAAYYNLGRIVHLLEDMSAVPHVHRDAHGGSMPGTGGVDTYESNLGELYVQGNPAELSQNGLSGLLISPVQYLSHKPILFENINKNYIPLEQLALGTPFQTPIEEWKSKWQEKEFYNQTPLFRLFYSMCETTDNFPCNDVDGDRTAAGGFIGAGWINGNIEGHEDNWKLAANEIMPRMTQHVAGLFRLFWMSTHFPTTYNSNSNEYGGFLEDEHSNIANGFKNAYKSAFENGIFLGSPADSCLVRKFQTHYYRTYNHGGLFYNSNLDIKQGPYLYIGEGIWNKWLILGGVNSRLGLPRSSEENNVVNFENGKIKWLPNNPDNPEVTYNFTSDNLINKGLDIIIGQTTQQALQVNFSTKNVLTNTSVAYCILKKSDNTTIDITNSISGYNYALGQGSFTLPMNLLTDFNSYTLMLRLNYTDITVSKTLDLIGTIHKVGAFSDIGTLGTDFWARSEIYGGVQYGLFKGIGDKFMPTKKLTRGQFAKIIASSAVLLNKIRIDTTKSNLFVGDLGYFTDVQQTNEFYRYIQTLRNWRIISSTNATFRPNDYITLGEVSKIMVNALDYTVGNDDCLKGWKNHNNIIPENHELASYAEVLNKNFVEVKQNTKKAVKNLFSFMKLGSNKSGSADLNSSISRADMAKIIVASYEQLKNASTKSNPLADYTVIGDKYEMPDSCYGEVTTATMNRFFNMQDNQRLTLRFSSPTDAQGNPLYFYWTSDKGDMTTDSLNSYPNNRKIIFTPPKVTQPDSTTLYLHVGCQTGKMKEYFITVNLRPGGTMPQPGNLVLTQNDNQITLNWGKPQNDALCGYKIYRNNKNIVSISNATQTTFSETLPSGSYTYTVTALFNDPVGESAPSNSQSVVIIGTEISRVEYFVDNDPGMGNGIAVNSGKQPDIDMYFNADLKTVTDGFHVLYTRAKDKSGSWSFTVGKPFLKQSLSGSSLTPDITKLEYFIDTDPGVGHGIDVPVAKGVLADKHFTANLYGLADGFHVLYVRSKNSNGIWSFNYAKPFLKQQVAGTSQVPDITKLEYFIDTDPGIGQGVNISLTQGIAVDKSFIVDLNVIENGFHILYVRSKNSNGIWSFNYAKPFLKQQIAGGSAVPKITQLEYFIDTDPGVGQGIKIALEPAILHDQTFIVNLKMMTVGSHKLYLRTKNEKGIWSMNTVHSFNVTAASGIAEDNLPKETKLYQNYPNPFNPETTVKFDLKNSGKVKIGIYNIKGEQVRSLVNSQMTAGRYAVVISSNEMSSGVYLMKMQAEGYEKVLRANVVK